MKKLFTEEQLNELIREPEFSCFEAILYGATLTSTKSSSLLNSWKELAHDDYLKGSLSNYWLSEVRSFSKFAPMLEKKVHQMAIGKYQGKDEYALLYFFLQNGDLRTWIGHMPLEELPEIFSKLAIDLAPLYRIHNGFYNLDFGEPGYLPIGRTEIFKNPENPLEKGFLKLFEHGTSVMGIDLDNGNNKAYIIWSSDEEVEQIESIWVELDSWLTDIIEEYDDAW